jgi:hypothetical protein
MSLRAISIYFLGTLAPATAAPETHPTPAAATESLPPADQCNTATHRQFDFWVGSWKVYRADNDKLVARSLIEKLYNGCAVRENWMPLHGFGGGSLNSYEPRLKQWRQFWTDSGNEVHDYSGSWDGKRLVMTGSSEDPSGKKQRLRMTYEQLGNGDVVQTGYVSPGGSKDWKLDYKLIYRRDVGSESAAVPQESPAGRSN